MSEISPVLKLTLRKIPAQYVMTPQFSLVGGTYYSAQLLELSCDVAGARIYYTLDGSVPDEASALYSSPISIEQSVTVTARAFKVGMFASRIVSQSYNLVLGIPVPVAMPATDRNIGSFRANWERVSGAVCHLTVSRNAAFTDILNGYLDKPVAGVSCLLSNIESSAGKTFYYKLRCSVDGVFGDYSNVVHAQLGFGLGGNVETYIDPLVPNTMYWIHIFDENDTFILKNNNFDSLVAYVIAGGGGGGGCANGTLRAAGGGGAGDVLTVSGADAFVVDAAYTVQVGVGGLGGIGGQRGLQGQASRIYKAGTNYIANGGCGGGAGLSSYSVYSNGDASNGAGNCGGGASNGIGGQQSGHKSGGDGYEYSNVARGGGGGSDFNDGCHGAVGGCGGNGGIINTFGFIDIVAGGGGSGATMNGAFVPAAVHGSIGAGYTRAASAGIDLTGGGGGGGSHYFPNGGKGGKGAVYIIFTEFI